MMSKSLRNGATSWCGNSVRPRVRMHALKSLRAARYLGLACLPTGEGFVATELNRDLKDPARYLTLDFWESREAYDAFRAQHAAEYAAIDRECEALTAEEKALGAFERIVSG